MDGTEIRSLWGREIKEFQAFRDKKKKKKKKEFNAPRLLSIRTFRSFYERLYTNEWQDEAQRERERERALTRSHLENDGYNLKSSFEKSLKSENKVQGVLTIKFDSSYREKKKKKKLMPGNKRDF